MVGAGRFGDRAPPWAVREMYSVARSGWRDWTAFERSETSNKASNISSNKIDCLRCKPLEMLANFFDSTLFTRSSFFRTAVEVSTKNRNRCSPLMRRPRHDFPVLCNRWGLSNLMTRIRSLRPLQFSMISLRPSALRVRSTAAVVHSARVLCSGLASAAAIEPGGDGGVSSVVRIYGSSGGRSDGAQIVRSGLARLSISDDVERDLLSLIELTHPSAFDCADVHEDVLAAVIRLDEAEAFLDIEPLHGSLRHLVLLSVTCVLRPRASAAGSVEFWGKVVSPTRGARRGQVVRPKLDRGNVGYCGCNRKGVARIF